MNPKQRWIMGILGVLVVVVWARGLTARPVHAVRPGHGVHPSALRLRSGQASAQDERRVEGRGRPSLNNSRFTEWGGNPFEKDHKKPAVSILKEPVDDLLTGILWDSNTPSAIVNNRLVGVGDRVGRWEVKEITRDSVLLSDGATTKKLISKGGPR